MVMIPGAWVVDEGPANTLCQINPDNGFAIAWLTAFNELLRLQFDK
jgi:hypothetical protein